MACQMEAPSRSGIARSSPPVGILEMMKEKGDSWMTGLFGPFGEIDSSKGCVEVKGRRSRIAASEGQARLHCKYPLLKGRSQPWCVNTFSKGANLAVGSGAAQAPRARQCAADIKSGRKEAPKTGYILIHGHWNVFPGCFLLSFRRDWAHYSESGPCTDQSKEVSPDLMGRECPTFILATR